MDDYGLLVSRDTHIRKEEWKRLIESRQALIFQVDGNFAGNSAIGMPAAFSRFVMI